MSIKRISWNFSGIVYHNYLKTLISTIENVDILDGTIFHYAAIVRAYLNQEYNSRVEEYEPVAWSYNLLI